MTKQYCIRAQDYTKSLIPDAVLDVADPAHALISITDTNQPISLSNFMLLQHNINPDNRYTK
jgi:hypothetical protein